MSKELNIIEASNMPVGTEFKVKFKSGNFEYFNITLIKNNSGKLFNWCDDSDVTPYSDLINAKFIPIQKPVKFMEVVKSDKECRVEHELIEYADNFREGEYYPFDWVLYSLSELLTLEKLRKIILEGNWYIKE